MKKNLFQFAIIMTLCFNVFQLLNAQRLPSLAITGCESKNTTLSSLQFMDIMNIEIKKINLFDVIDKNDVLLLAKENQIDVTTCLSKTCMSKLGKMLKTDKSFSAQLEKFNDKIYISIRQLDNLTEEVEKNYSMEYLGIDKEISLMVSLTLKKMYDIPFNNQEYKSVSTEQALDSKINNPDIKKLNLSGPRFGFSYITGNDGKSYRRPVSQGGYDATPLISHFGYQFEVAYLNQGNIQGLFEFIPAISAVEHGLFIPSIAFLHGVRSNKSGWEFSVGPSFNFSKRSEGYYNDNGQWIRIDGGKVPADKVNSITKELDKNGKLVLEGGLLLGLGKSIKSGNVNFPFNLYCILRKDSPRFGLSMGFNTKK